MTDLNSSFFNVERDGAVVVLEMNRPDRANSMSPDFWTDLPILAAALNEDPTVRCVVLTGAGRHFTGGMDLATFADINTMLQDEPGRVAYALRDLILRLQGSLSSLEKLRVPVIAAIHGACLGGGIDLISACDLRLASADASFGIEEIHIGMAADVGTLQRLPRLMPPAIVHELAYTGRRFSAEEARGWGLINDIQSNREKTVEAALKLAQEIAAKSPLAVAGVKQAITYSRDHSVEDALEHMATWNSGMLRAEDLMKAITAKTAKQEAVFNDLLKPSI